jgi:hypothetical protein
MSYQIRYCTRAIISRGLPYIFNPIFHCGLYCRAELVLQTIYVLNKEILQFLNLKSAAYNWERFQIKSGLFIYIILKKYWYLNGCELQMLMPFFMHQTFVNVPTTFRVFSLPVFYLFKLLRARCNLRVLFDNFLGAIYEPGCNNDVRAL